MAPTSKIPIYYGWRVVGVCFVAAVFTWGFGTFGASVYLAEVTKAHGWPIALVSSGVTVFYLTAALSAMFVGRAIDRHGSRLMFVAGSMALGVGTAAVGSVSAVWQLYAAFVILGLGYSVMSVTGLSATVAPWFERHQGRSIAMALTGASVGAMVVVPLFVLAIQQFGFPAAARGGGVLTVLLLVPLALFVLRYRRPQDIGLMPDGAPSLPVRAGPAATPAAGWTRATAIRTSALRTTTIAFALGLVVQVGFLTHHMKLAEPLIGATGAGWLVGATGTAGLIGRLILARVADVVSLRHYTGAIMGTQALVLLAIAVFPTMPVLIGGSLVYGFCLGQITTLSPIVVRREFGAASYGAIYGAAAMVIQFSSALGPAVYGALRDLLGGYGPVLATAAAFELAAMAVILAGRAPGPAPAEKGQPAVDAAAEGG
ncbi:MFS family permease [Constrictibacter sp. MBR-5]|jgi:MFS family permease|uniref:MFS transporter n=1 Tax=Constrictibacter sp. MBR-5 TaxID=3156467 RepID=UPI00339B9D1F